MCTFHGWVKLSFVILGTSWLFLFVNSEKNAAPAQAQPKYSDDGGRSCRKLMMIMAKRMMRVITACTKEVKAKFQGESDFHTHFQCTIKCFMQRVNMTDANHMLSNATFSLFLQDQIPDSYHVLAYKVLKPCMDEAGPKIDPNDEKCIAYGDFIKCMQAQATDNC